MVTQPAWLVPRENSFFRHLGESALGGPEVVFGASGSALESTTGV